MSVNQSVTESGGGSKNQFQLLGYSYDSAGNVLNDGIHSGCGTNAFAWNAEEQMSCGTGTTYTYDGDAERVKKTGGSSTPTLYWGGQAGEALAESDLAGTLTSEYIFFNGKRIARRDPPSSVYYYFPDMLGSSNVVTNATGTIQNESDFYPFGGERQITSNLANQHYKFTGKERDSESGNDYFGARYYASSMGRWLSPDTDMTLKRILPNPQRWNRYVYVINNPLTRFDPDGLTDYAVFLAYSAADRGGHHAANWSKIQADAVKHGNTVTIYQGSTGDHAANAANLNAAFANGQTTVVIGHSDLADTGDGRGMHAAAIRLQDSSLGDTSVIRGGDGKQVDALGPVNGGTVAIFSCDSISLAGQFGGADSFVGVDSGKGAGDLGLTGLETSIPGLLAAGSTFVDVLATGGSTSDAVSQANKAINVQPDSDTGDKVIKKP